MKSILDMMDDLNPTETIQADVTTDIQTPEIIEEARRNPPFIKRTLATIEAVDEYAQNRGSMGLDFGMQNLNEAFNGLNPGLTLVAGGANTGRHWHT